MCVHSTCTYRSCHLAHCACLRVQISMFRKDMFMHAPNFFDGDGGLAFSSHALVHVLQLLHHAVVACLPSLTHVFHGFPRYTTPNPMPTKHGNNDSTDASLFFNLEAVDSNYLQNKAIGLKEDVPASATGVASTELVWTTGAKILRRYRTRLQLELLLTRPTAHMIQGTI